MMGETRNTPPRTYLEWFTLLRDGLPSNVSANQIGEAVPEFLRQSAAWRQPAPRSDPASSDRDAAGHRRHGEARARILERQLAEGPNEILAALNLWHGFSLAHRDPFHPRRGRRLQLALGPWGRSFLGSPVLLGPLVAAIEGMAALITSAGLGKDVEQRVTEHQSSLTMQLVQDQEHVNRAVEAILDPHTVQGAPRIRTLLGGDTPREVSFEIWQRAWMTACVRSPEILNTMVLWWNRRVAMALLARLSAAPPEWRRRVYRCAGPTCRAPYQLWLAQPGAGRPPTRYPKSATPARCCRACRALSKNSRVKFQGATRRIPA
jgi:hypothetical protein